MSSRKFTTFEGVFTPCLLSILGVIMYLRLGWVVGQMGFAGTLLIILLANSITLSSVLSMASVLSNIRIGAGGAYSIITKSLGVEAGGAIGIPLYISQAVSVAFYVTGFTECWAFVFPEHPGLLVAIITWFLLLLVSYVSASLAFRVQYIIMVLIGLSLISICLGKGNPNIEFSAWNGFQGRSFWQVFAIFFPAVTGILAGASMSGELKDPRNSIPKGTLWAIFISLFIYIGLAYLYSKNVSLEVLRTKTSIALEMGRWRLLVIAGIMGATISSAISMFVSSPRILLALGKHSILPGSEVFSRINKRGEPANAILFTALISFITLLFGTLDQIASLLTMFFLITYGMINITVFIEQSIGIASFRPTFRIPRLIPLLGTVGCVGVMFLVNVKFSVFAFLVIAVIYIILLRQEAQIHSPDIRSGMLVFLAEQFAKAASRLPYYPKIWKPNVFVPVLQDVDYTRLMPFIEAIISPSGRLTIFKIQVQTSLSDRSEENIVSSRKVLEKHLHPLKSRGIFVESGVVESREVYEGGKTILQTLQGIFFPPNTFLYALDEDGDEDEVAFKLIDDASKQGLGIIAVYIHPKLGFSRQRKINLWIRQQSPNIDLSVLVSLQLERNWGASLQLVQVVQYEYEREEAEAYLDKLKILLRLPLDVDLVVLVGHFKDVLQKAPPADVNIFGMQEQPQIQIIRDFASNIKTSVIFLKDSKHESALA